MLNITPLDRKEINRKRTKVINVDVKITKLKWQWQNRRWKIAERRPHAGRRQGCRRICCQELRTL